MSFHFRGQRGDDKDCAAKQASGFYFSRNLFTDAVRR